MPAGLDCALYFGPFGGSFLGYFILCFAFCGVCLGFVWDIFLCSALLGSFGFFWAHFDDVVIKKCIQATTINNGQWSQIT